MLVPSRGLLGTAAAPPCFTSEAHAVDMLWICCGYADANRGLLGTAVQKELSRPMQQICYEYAVDMLSMCYAAPPYAKYAAECRATGRPKGSRSVLPKANLIFYYLSLPLLDFTTFYCKTLLKWLMRIADAWVPLLCHPCHTPL